MGIRPKTTEELLDETLAAYGKLELEMEYRGNDPRPAKKAQKEYDKARTKLYKRIEDLEEQAIKGIVQDFEKKHRKEEPTLNIDRDVGGKVVRTLLAETFRNYAVIAGNQRRDGKRSSTYSLGHFQNDLNGLADLLDPPTKKPTTRKKPRKKRG